MKNIKSYKVFESDEYKQKHLRKLNKLEIKILSDFITFMEIIKDEFPHDKESYIKFKSKIEPFEKYGYTKPMDYMIKKVERAINHEENYAELTSKEKEFMSQHKQIIDLLRNGNVDKAIEVNQGRSEYVEEHIEMQKGVNHYIDQMRNPYYKKWTIFSREGELISDFNEESIEKLSKVKDNLKDKWTYLEFPKGKVHDFQYMIYFINELKDKGYSHKVKDIKNYLKFKYSDNKDFKELLDIVERYLYDNDKKLIPKIMDKIKTLEDVLKMNEKSKRKIKTVYRGIGFRDEDFEDMDLNRSNIKEEIIEREKENKYVATSKKEHSAKNFAYMKGHLDSGRNSDLGFIIEYDVSPESIILDTEIFGSVFGESEVLIDTRKAKIKNIKRV